MKNLQISVLTLFSMLIFSCTKNDEIKIDPANLLIGTWNYSGDQDNLSIFARTREFEDKHCYKFNSDGTLLERNISGWCGTPPVFYENYEGTWTLVNDTLIQISVAYWGGMRDYRLKISSVNRDFLKTEYVPMEEK